MAVRESGKKCTNRSIHEDSDITVESARKISVAPRTLLRALHARCRNDPPRRPARPGATRGRTPHSGTPNHSSGGDEAPAGPTAPHARQEEHPRVPARFQLVSYAHKTALTCTLSACNSNRPLVSTAPDRRGRIPTDPLRATYTRIAPVNQHGIRGRSRRLSGQPRSSPAPIARATMTTLLPWTGGAMVPAASSRPGRIGQPLPHRSPPRLASRRFGFPYGRALDNSPTAGLR